MSNYNYYPYNEWYVPQQMPENLYRATPNRRFDLWAEEANEQSLGDGFFRYLWTPPVRIVPNEIVDFRLNAKANQQVISAGYATDPLEDIYAIQMYPRHTNVMAVLLRSRIATNTTSKVDMWLIVKQN
ncbi:TPA: hypothetical protein R9Z04_006019 [Bacillus cereus]|nr:hypothetical protein [Bacillus cereus]